MNHLIILVGVSGSGKTTFAKTMTNTPYEADNYPGLYVNGRLQVHLLSKAHEWCQQQVRLAMSEQVPFLVQSNTNLEPRHLLPYLESASYYGYQVRLILPSHGLLYYQTPQDQVSYVIQVRSQGERIVPEHAMKRMIDQFVKHEPLFIRLTSISDPREMIHQIESKLQV
jgi:predicted kinase